MALRFPDPFLTPWRRTAGILQKIKAFRRDEGGSFAILGAIVIVVLCGFVFVAYDYAKLLGHDTEYQNAADNGALYLAKVTEAEFRAGRVPSIGPFYDGLRKFVRENLSTQAASNVATTGEFDPAGQWIKVTVCGNHESTFGTFTGTSTMQACGVGVVNASVDLIKADIHVLVDTSDSMGLAATDAGRRLLKKRTLAGVADGLLNPADVGLGPTTGSGPQEGCSFACHAQRAGRTAYARTTFDYAKQDNTTQPRCPTGPGLKRREQLCDNDGPVRLRIDVARDGIRNFITALTNAPGDFMASLTYFNSDVYEIQSPTRALANIKSAVDNLTLGSNGALTVLPNNADTRPDLFGSSFKQYLTNYIGSSTATRRKQYVFLVTDGVAGVVGGAPPAGVWLFNQSFCDQIKALNDPANGVPNVKVVVLYTKYLDERTDRLWNNLVGALYPNIEDNMKACASTPELYASGDTPTEIAAAFREILEGITSDAAALRLTQ